MLMLGCICLTLYRSKLFIYTCVLITPVITDHIPNYLNILLYRKF